MKIKNILYLAILVLPISLSAFSLFSSDEDVVELEIKVDNNANRGTPFYLILKEVEKGEFLKHDYQDIVKEAYPTTNKTTLYPPQVILPGKTYTLDVPRNNADKLLAIYFLYTDPGQDWKLLVDATNRVRIQLGENQITKVKTE